MTTKQPEVLALAASCGAKIHDGFSNTPVHFFSIVQLMQFAAALSQPPLQGGVPAGFVLVPVEPTPEMIAALFWNGEVYMMTGHAAIAKEGYQFYKDMLAAAPQTPIADQGEQISDAARLNWLANAVLACDYGDNSEPGEQIGWCVQHSRRNNAPFMFGKSINAAIDAAIQQSAQVASQK